MNLDFSFTVKTALLPELKKFDFLQLIDPLIITGLVSDVMVKLDELSDTYPGFKGNIIIKQDDDISLIVSWNEFDKMNIMGRSPLDKYIKDEITFYFNPLRTSKDKTKPKDDPITAYDRAMSIL